MAAAVQVYTSTDGIGAILEIATGDDHFVLTVSQEDLETISRKCDRAAVALDKTRNPEHYA